MASVLVIVVGMPAGDGVDAEATPQYTTPPMNLSDTFTSLVTVKLVLDTRFKGALALRISGTPDKDGATVGVREGELVSPG
jgi:hypothetical protein